MSSELANNLINAESIEAFLRQLNGDGGWQIVSMLKAEVDRLLGCDLNQASTLVDRIEQLAARLNDPLSKAFAEASRARVLHFTGRHSQADEFYERAINAMRTAKLRTEAARIQKQHIDALKHLGRYADALQVARAARRVLARSDAVELAQLETNVGNIYYQLDRYKKALEHYDRAREIFQSAGDDAMRAFVDFSRSNVFTETDRPDEALTLLESAAAAWEKAGRDLLAAQARFHIAYLQFLKGNYNSALTSYYQARDRLSELGSNQLVAFCNLDIAETLLALNAFDEANESAAVARATFTDLGMEYESAKAAMIEALAMLGLRQFDAAQTDLLAARELFQRSGNKTFAALADSYLAELAIQKGDTQDAINRASAALKVFGRQRLATRIAHLKLLQARAAYQAGDKTKSARMARAALRAVEKLFAPGVSYQAYHLLGRIERDRKLRSNALDYFRRAVETIEKLRGGISADEFKATFLRDKIEAYEDAISACLDEGSREMIEEAFRLVESSKSRALADLLARYVREPESGSGSQFRGPSAETRARLQKLIEDLNWYSSQAGLEDDKGSQRSAEVAERYRAAVVKYERQIARLFRRLEHEDAAFADIQRMRAASVSDLRDALEEDETAIEYFTTGDQVSAFIASRNGVRVARGIASKRELERVLAALRFQIEKFNYGSEYVEAYFGQLKRATGEHLAHIYKSIFAPVERMIESERLIIIPHGALHYVPFHALCDANGYLIERFEISYAPSAAVLKLCRARRSQLEAEHAQSANSKSRNSNLRSRPNSLNGDLLVALGMVERGTPNIEEEIDALAALFPKSVRLTGNEATRANLKRFAPQARFLHLASHGYFRRDNPMFSFLKLADSHLNFYSLLDLKLNAEMVTLSACHTGVNMVFPGDELHGLMRGFLHAGAPSLVASLWAVSDRSTAEFMREMYGQIRAGAAKRAALRAAQLRIKDDYGHPYYWAPFVLMGNPL